MRTLKILAAIAILTGAGVACGGSDNGGAIQTPPPSSSAANGATIDANASLKFAPPTLTVKAGTTVTWKVVGAIPHSVKASSGGTFDSGTLQEGQTFSQTFSTPGTIHYFCTIHGAAIMSGTITVTS